MKHFLLILSLIFSVQAIQAQESFKYEHILITNDDGIEDAERLLALAKSVKRVSNRVSVIVSSFDRSGTSNYTTYGKYQSTMQVTCKYHDSENNIAIYVTPGNPADCVMIGLSGLFKDDRPDLVLSGINSGANIGTTWFGSGTVGAIRTSSIFGVKGIALSGFDDDDPRSFTVIPNWVTELISSDLIEEMGKNSYLTVGFPDTPLEEVKGIKVAPRKISFTRPESIAFQQVHGNAADKPENTTIWVLTSRDDSHTTKAPKNDEDYLKEGYIVITPMSIDENHPQLLSVFRKKFNDIPKFSLKN